VKNLTPAKMTMLMFVVIGLLVAAYVAKTLFAVDDRPAVRNIPMPLSELEPGTRITQNHIGLGPWPESEITSDMLLSERAILGRIVKEKLKPGRPILANQLYQFGERPPLRVAEGMRAVTVDIEDSAAAVGGLIRPGQYVDVHWTIEPVQDDPRLAQGMTLTLFRGVQVLAVHRQYSQVSGDAAAMPTTTGVTLELTPEQATVAILAREKGTITLTYNPDGKGTGVVDVPDENRATFYEILGMNPPEEAKEEPPFTSEIYRGTARQTMQFRDGRLIRSGSSGSGRPQRAGSNPSAPNSSSAQDQPSPQKQGQPRTSASPGVPPAPLPVTQSPSGRRAPST